MKKPLLTDCHIHALAFDSKKSEKYGNIIHKSFKNDVSHWYIARNHNLNFRDPDFNEKYISNLNTEIEKSQTVGKGIIFGLDGVYDDKGNLDKNRTDFMITNDYVFDAIQKKKYLKFGASINPMRKDALDELEKSVDRKASLVKVLPNTQGFAPDDKKYKKFYRSIVKHKIPLLIHSGYEFALKPIDQSYGNPDRYKMALDEGVEIIGAHGCATGLMFVELYKKTILELIEKYPNFYMDVSALSVITRTGIVPFLRKHEEILPRLLFGTDFPIPAFIYTFYFSLGLKKFREIKKINNYFDQYAKIMNELGLLPHKPPIVFK
ncbi:MAG: amidohydrolase [Spirochaetia bacterium]|nr:amidohydrolase [Spirochaetia bacterium]